VAFEWEKVRRRSKPAQPLLGVGGGGVEKEEGRGVYEEFDGWYTHMRLNVSCNFGGGLVVTVEALRGRG
jgi:hypothetical protein